VKIRLVEYPSQGKWVIEEQLPLGWREIRIFFREDEASNAFSDMKKDLPRVIEEYDNEAD
jgi:hypothetical protein